MPRYTTEEFDRKKAEYVAQYGYTMNIPGFRDIVKIGIDKPPTEYELDRYKAKDMTELSPKRFEEIKQHMNKKRESFLRMMGSPTPSWIQNIGTTMTFLDNVNDAAGTLSVVCRTAAKLVPKTLAKAFMGPAGWALLAADIANLAMTVMHSPITAVSGKNDLSRASTTNPFCKEAKVTRAARLRRLKPSKGEVIEALQTTEQVFGIGLSLGPIVGAMIEAFTGPYRVLTGKKVQVKWPIPDFGLLGKYAINGLLGSEVLNTGGQELSDEDHTKTYLVANMATQVLYPLFQEYHPLDQIEGIENIELTAPKPTDPSTKLIFEEEGIDPLKHIGFPHADREHVSASELMDIGYDHNHDSFMEYAQNTKHTHHGWIGAQCVNDFTQNALALLEGDDQVELDFHPVEKACFKLMDRGYIFRKGTAYNSLQGFADRVMEFDKQGIEPDFKTIRDTIAKPAGIPFRRKVERDIRVPGRRTSFRSVLEKLQFSFFLSLLWL